MRYLLDTNIVSALVRDPHGPVTRRIRDIGEANVFTSIIVAAELRYGATKKGSTRLHGWSKQDSRSEATICSSLRKLSRSDALS